eukprot:TRINITY_DN15541_c0_g1_i1.p1 TRINITY_DN15541_c0_g1~~TRINITY_DN15541_c0_g1_i1.p1  ORF type:complete len:515 (+),score=97.92 TRINITY_DN15541_c0_g1_i1:38-1582(+)
MAERTSYGCCPGCGDLDDVFSYNAPRVVRIRDRKLGIARWTIICAILIWVIVWEIIINAGYQVKEIPHGIMTTTLRRGATESTTRPSYCTDSTRSVAGALPCVWVDEIGVHYPNNEEYSMFLTTRITRTEVTHTSACESGFSIYNEIGNARSYSTENGNTCPTPTAFNVLNKQDGLNYYVGDIEDFTMMWAHAVYGPLHDVVKHSADLDEAKIALPSGDRHFVPRSDSPVPDADGLKGFTKGDIVSVRALIDAANTNYQFTLDDVSDVTASCTGTSESACIAESSCFWSGPHCTGWTTQAECAADNACTWSGSACDSLTASLCSPATNRYDGVVIMVVIDYRTPGLDSDSLEYIYRVRYIPKSEYKIVERQVTDTKTVYTNRHGIRVVFVHAGHISVFSFRAMVLSLVAGAALFAASTFIVEYIIFKILPQKHIYEHLKFITSKDLGDVHVTDEDPLGGMDADDFVYGMKRPGKAVILDIDEADILAEEEDADAANAPDEANNPPTKRKEDEVV